MKRSFFVSLLAFILLGSSATSCRQEESRAVDVKVAGFDITVRDDPPNLRIVAGGRLLADVDGTRFAFRPASATYETKYGSYRIVETPESEWQHATKISGVVSTNGELTFALLDAAGAPLGHVKVHSPDPGHLVVTATAEAPSHNRAKMGFDCRPDDHFVGLGHQSADVDHRGQNVPLFTSEPGIGKSDTDDYEPLWFIKGRKHASSVPIPAVVSSRGTAWLLDTYAYANFDLCSSVSSQVNLEAWERELRFHVFDGPTPLEALSRMTAFTGRPRLPPPWAFAPWNDALFGPDNVRAFAKFLRDNKIPSSAIWSEDFRGGFKTTYGYRIAPNWRPDPTLYPDLSKLIADLRAQGFAMQLYFNPHVISGADVAADARDKDVLLKKANGERYAIESADGTFGATNILDLTRRESREWAKALMKEAIALGGLGWMADFGEWMPIDDAKPASGENPELVHNRYPVLWQQTNREAMEEAGKLDEMCVYFRSGHLRSQREATIMWAGDQRTSFQADDGLPSIIPIGLGLAATGFPFFAHDIGGYQFLGNEAPETRSKELFIRWTELGAFTPIMRTHHGIKVAENWTVDRDAETTEIWRRYASLHIQLYPFWRGLAVRAVNEGRPLWIPMGLVHPEDEAAWGVRDQFYVGGALLVAPVVEAGATKRRVHLPPGRFAPLLSRGDALTGPSDVTVDAGLSEIPVFIAAGGLVPMTREPAMTLLEGSPGLPGLETTRGDRTLYVGLGASGMFVEDDGATYRLEGSGTDLQGLSLDANGGVVVTGNATLEGKDFKLTLSGHPESRRTLVVFR